MFVRWVHSSNKHCVAVYRPISTRFSAFFRMDCFFGCITWFSFFCRQVAPKVSRNCGQKLRKTTYIAIFSAESDGATANRQIPNRKFSSLSQHFEKCQRRQLSNDLDALTAVCQRTGCVLQSTKRFVVPSAGGATRFANLCRKFSKTQKKSAAELCQILSIVTLEIVINSTP